MSDLSQVNGYIFLTSQLTIPTDDTYKPAYGTGLFETSWIDEYELACRTTDGECEFLLEDINNNVRVRVIKGDMERIKDIVKQETDHFDSELTWMN